jgi:hypothetical protein
MSSRRSSKGEVDPSYKDDYSSSSSDDGIIGRKKKTVKDNDDDDSASFSSGSRAGASAGASASGRKSGGGNNNAGGKKSGGGNNNAGGKKSGGGKKGAKKKSATSHDPPGPLPTKLHEFEDAIHKGESLPRGTIKKFKTLNIGVDDGVVLEICMEALRDGYEIIKKYHNNGDLSITFKTMNGDRAHERGLYLLWKHNQNQWKLGAVTLLSSYLLNRVRPQLPEECDPTEYSMIVATLTELKALADKENGKLWGYVDRIIEEAASFTVYKDHSDNNRDEVLIFLMEFIFSACLPDVNPGYILERPLLFGSKSMHDLVRLPQHNSNGFLVDLYKKLQKNDNNPNDSRLTVFQTWEPIMSAIAAAMRSSLDNETESLNEARAMFEAACKNLFLEGEYVQKFSYHGKGANE